MNASTPRVLARGQRRAGKRRKCAHGEGGRKKVRWAQTEYELIARFARPDGKVGSDFLFKKDLEFKSNSN